MERPATVYPVRRVSPVGKLFTDAGYQGPQFTMAADALGRRAQLGLVQSLPSPRLEPSMPLKHVRCIFGFIQVAGDQHPFRVVTLSLQVPLHHIEDIRANVRLQFH
jgi:hypothetical protein